MAAANVFPELICTIFLVIYYCLEALVLAFVPNSLRTHKSVQGEIALITGAGHGIGRALALRFAELGCTVVLLDINEVWLEGTRQEIAENGGKVFAYICDVSSRKEVYSCAKTVVNEVGDVTILVNNAGIVCAKYLLDIPDESVLSVFRTNTFAHFWTLKAFLPFMMEQNHGHVITVASIVGKGAGSKASEYISSKFAAVGLHEAMETELRVLRRTGIHMTLVCPGLVDTGMFAGAEYRFPRVVRTLKVDQLADDIIDAVLLNEHILITPFLADIAVKTKYLLPYKAFDTLADFGGATHMLDHFSGHDTKKFQN